MQFCFWILQEHGVISTAGCKIYTVDDDTCNNKTCKNNGTCLNLYNVTSDICDCPDGLKPTDCSSDVICADEPCENEGVCRKNRTNSMCSCVDGFEGYYCEQETNYCKTSPCKNNATCLDLQNGFKCVCSSNFTGKTCDETPHKESNQESSDEQRVPAWIAALASIGGLLALVGLGVCIYKLKPDKATGTEPLKAKQRKRVKQKLNKVQTVEMTTVKPYS